jgi:hypothetical protein
MDEEERNGIFTRRAVMDEMQWYWMLVLSWTGTVVLSQLLADIPVNSQRLRDAMCGLTMVAQWS